MVSITARIPLRRVALEHNIDDPVLDHDDLPRRFAVEQPTHGRFGQGAFLRHIILAIARELNGGTQLAVHLNRQSHDLIDQERGVRLEPRLRNQHALVAQALPHLLRQMRHHGRKQFRNGTAPDVPAGRVPRIARLMALAIRCNDLIRDGVIANESELADFGQITTARMTQIMSLLNLAPDIQEHILFLPRTENGRDIVKETDVRPIASTLDWCKRRRMWAALQRDGGEANTSSR